MGHPLLEVGQQGVSRLEVGQHPLLEGQAAAATGFGSGLSGAAGSQPTFGNGGGFTLGSAPGVPPTFGGVTAAAPSFAGATYLRLLAWAAVQVGSPLVKLPLQQLLDLQTHLQVGAMAA